jgi:hypothetical protein
MFSDCYALRSIPSTLKIPSGVTDATKMFYNCKNLTTIPATFTIADSVQYLTGMFQISGVQSLPSSFILPSSAIKLDYMFCATKIKYISTLLTIPTQVVTTEGMYSGCTELQSIPAAFKIPANVKDTSYMFANTGIKTIPADLLTEGTTTITGMFKGSTVNNISNFTIPSTVTLANELFRECSSLVFVPDSFKIPGAVQNASWMFQDCTGLKTISNGFTIENGVKDISGLFSSTQISTIPNSFVLPNSITNASYLFNDCLKLATLHDDFTFANTSVSNLNSVFAYCESLTSLPDSFALNNSVTDIHGMFLNCFKLQKLPIKFAIPSSVTNATNTFCNCKSLTGRLVINANLNSITQMFYGTIAPIIIQGTSPQLDSIAATSSGKNIFKYTEFGNNNSLIRIFIGSDIRTNASTYKKTSDYFLANSSGDRVEFVLPTSGSVTIPDAVSTYKLYKDAGYEFCYWMVNGRPIDNTVTVEQLVQLNGGDKNIIIYPCFVKS